MSTMGINMDFYMYTSLLEPSYKVVHTVQGTKKPRKVYIHLMDIGKKLNINECVILQKGNGVFVTNVKGEDKIVF
ncbi:45896_t:CDS:1, partial [Gigaspora margarita]